MSAAAELAKAVLQVEQDLEIMEGKFEKTQYFSDSRVVLDWINNSTDCFASYVTARLKNITDVSESSQWHYVPTHLNPANIATRPISVTDLIASRWTAGPEFLQQEIIPTFQEDKPSIKTLKSTTNVATTYENIPEGRTWARLIASKLAHDGTLNEKSAADQLILQAQKLAFPNGLAVALENKQDKSSNNLRKWDAFVDKQTCLIKAYGRLARADFNLWRKYPTIIPDNEIGNALLGFIHHQSHVGRMGTLQMIQNVGFLPIFKQPQTKRIINTCMRCKKVRAPVMKQKMANLPIQRLFKTPPFLHCGMDVFGHFLVRDGRPTRTRPGTRKVWVLIITCLYSRAVHLEILESMTTESFKMAFQRFQDLRENASIYVVTMGLTS